jgi:hypothetical protein
METDRATSDYFKSRKILYGLPCAECKTYYPSDLAICPVCKCRERLPAQPAASVK